MLTKITALNEAQNQGITPLPRFVTICTHHFVLFFFVIAEMTQDAEPLNTRDLCRYKICILSRKMKLSS